MSRTFIAIGAGLALGAVACGAFGAHGLKDLSAERLGNWQTAAQYQMYHALAVVLVGILLHPALRGAQNRALRTAGWLFVFGVVVFSGSLYALVLTEVTKLGAVTPIGGVAFMAGWLSVMIGALKKPAD